ncbi:hypothetical protein CR513_13027, partial [Mucuna pruriens]
MQKIPYASTMGSQYMLKYLSDPRMQHWKIFKRMMRYSKRIKAYMLTYQKFEGLEIIKYFDSDFAGCQDSKRFTSRYIYMLAGGAISCMLVKQTLITSSTITIEPLKIYCDYNSIVLYSNNNRSSIKSKFIDTKFLKEFKINIFIKYIGISFMLANSLTKGQILKGHDNR